MHTLRRAEGGQHGDTCAAAPATAAIDGDEHARQPAYHRPESEPCDHEPDNPAPAPYARFPSPTGFFMLVLASTSVYRHELLGRLRLPMRALAPDVDETPRSRELPPALAARLALAKAQRVRERLLAGERQPGDKVIIGSDQVATLDGITPLGKPGNHERATAQLLAQSGRRVTFHTAVALVEVDTGAAHETTVATEVVFRTLDAATIEAYLRAEQPYDCAGSAKSEGLGIALLEAIEGPDATALIGLPLIAVCTMLQAAGIAPITAAR